MVGGASGAGGTGGDQDNADTCRRRSGRLPGAAPASHTLGHLSLLSKLVLSHNFWREVDHSRTTLSNTTTITSHGET